MIFAIGLLAALLAIATPAWAQQAVKIGTTPAVTFVVLYAAEHLGYLKAEGIAAQFADFEGGAEVTTAMVGGSIDFAGTYVDRPMILAEKGFAAKNVLAVLNRNPIFLVVRKNLPATDVKGLKGTKLGMTRAGSATDLALLALLRDAGLESDRDVAVIAVGSVRVAQKIFRAIIALQRPSYLLAITEEAMRTVNQFQKQAGVVKTDFPYDKIVAVQFKPLWDQ